MLIQRFIPTARCICAVKKKLKKNIKITLAEYLYSMLVHFIQRKGKGPWVVLMPVLIGFVLAEVADVTSFGTNYVGAVTFLLSGAILFMLDNKRQTVIEGEIIQKEIKLPRLKRINTLMWIEVRYWAMLMIAIGVVWLLSIK